jgi:hypothetical protein
MKIMLFGSSNPSGSAFLDLLPDQNVEIWGRKASTNCKYPHVYCDLSGDWSALQQSMRGILVSFGPIWLLSSFLADLHKNRPEHLHDLDGVVACSSSSFLTKRFAFNQFDKDLATRLYNAHSLLKNVCNALAIPCHIVAPTLVYGRVNGFTDKNLSKIIGLMKKVPFILLPRTTGQRQPIHAIQLARVMKQQTDKIILGEGESNNSDIIVVGGDETLTYEGMIVQLKHSLSANDPAQKCRLIKIPNRLFYLLSLPILLWNPKQFEALLRIQSNLSGFQRSHEILVTTPQQFPVLDTAIPALRDF